MVGEVFDRGLSDDNQLHSITKALMTVVGTVHIKYQKK